MDFNEHLSHSGALKNMRVFPVITRRNEVLELLKVSRSCLYNKINAGLWPKPISLSERAVGFLSTENEKVLAAMIAGQSEEEIKELVISLMSARKSLFREVM
jgi:prophage regulatory protein